MESSFIGKTIAGCEVISFIGKGGMGSVYRARHRQLEQDRAIKIMNPQLAQDEDFTKRFLIEARALAKMHHSNIVTVHDFCETPDGLCLIMEFVDGKTLAGRIKSNGPLTEREAIHIFRQILDAFEHAHKAGVLHRDIKPSNILIAESSIVKVTDFGLAKIQQQGNVTTTQLTGGTLYYVSPEQLEGLKYVDARSDLYSIGMTLYECLTGDVPFDKTTSDFRTSERIVKGDIPSPRTLNPRISRAMNDVVMKAIARNPDRRFQSAAEMRRGLDQVEAEATKLTTVQRRRRFAIEPRYVKYILGAGVGVLALMVGMNLLWPDRPLTTDSTSISQSEERREGSKTGENQQGGEEASKESTVGGEADEAQNGQSRKEESGRADSPVRENPRPLRIVVHDKFAKPMSNVIVRLRDNGGHDYSTKTNSQGEGVIQYNYAGNNLSTKCRLTRGVYSSSFKDVAIDGQQQSLTLDINWFFADWDKNLERKMRQARESIARENWKDAIAPLDEVVTLRSDRGSAEAYVLLGQAWFEEDEDNYINALNALTKAFGFKSGLGIVLQERLYYYLAAATYTKYDDLRNKKDAKWEQEQKRSMTQYIKFWSDLCTAKRKQLSQAIGEHNSDIQKIMSRISE